VKEKINALKQLVLKIAISSLFLSLICSLAFLFLTWNIFFDWNKNGIGRISLEIVIALFFIILIIILVFSWIGGFIFLVKNKSITEFKKIKSKFSLKIGILYFKVLQKIDDGIEEFSVDKVVINE